MLLSSSLLFVLCLVLSAFFSSSETAFIATKPHTLEYLEKKGSKRAGAVRKILTRVDDFLATILIGNTLVNVAAASLATSIASALVQSKEQAILIATAGTTLALLFFSEINPKVYAAHNPLKHSFFLAPIVRVFMFLFYPLVKVFTFINRMIVRSDAGSSSELSRATTEEETKALLHSGIKGLPAPRKDMIAEIFNLASRPVKEIMIPRPRIKAVEASLTREQILEIVMTEGFSRFPVYRGRMDHIEGLVYTKDLIPYLATGRPFDLAALLRKPFFVPESASVEKVFLQMQDKAVHLAFVVDEFGNVEGLVTIEDILEEIVGDIRDEYDDPEEPWYTPAENGGVIIKGSAGIKAINKALSLSIPESPDHTTLAGFFLYEFGRIPIEKDVLSHRGRRYVVEKMNKRHISLIRVER
jgi:putative hemolysin